MLRRELLVRLRRVTQDCQIVHSFGTDGIATVRVASNALGEIDTLRATPDGRLVLAGGNGYSELVGRLLENGRLDRFFGDGGWARFKPHERVQRGMPPPAPTATSIAFGRSGSMFLGGNDEGAHCCVQDFVTELSAAGRPMRAFGDGGSIVLPPTTIGSYTTDVSVNGDGSLYVLGEYEQSGCGVPSILRIRPDGALDKRFDAAVARTVKGIEGKRMRFTPRLVSRGRSGAFVLVGGLDATCVPAFPPAGTGSGGVAVEVRSSGRVEHVTRFPAPNYAFDTPAAIRLSSGLILAAALAYTTRGKLRSALVRAFRPDGLRAGVRTIPLSRLPRVAYVNLTLAPAAGNDVWLVVGLPKQVDLIPIRVGG